MLAAFVLPLFLLPGPAVAGAAPFGCTTVAIPEIVITVKNERGLVLGHGPTYQAGVTGKPQLTHAPTPEAVRKAGILAVAADKRHTYDIYVASPYYQPQTLRGIVVPWDSDGCHPITQKRTVTLKLQQNAPAVRTFRLTGMGRLFGIFLDAEPEIVRQGVTWTSSRPDLVPIDPRTGVMTPKCLNEREWTRITATLNAARTYKASATMPLEPNIKGCKK